MSLEQLSRWPARVGITPTWALLLLTWCGLPLVFAWTAQVQGRALAQANAQASAQAASDAMWQALRAGHPAAAGTPPAPDRFQTDALAAFRADPTRTHFWQQVAPADGPPGLRVAIPVRMQTTCINCHQQHTAAAPQGWTANDLAGVQDVTVHMAPASAPWRPDIVWGAYLLACAGVLVAALREYRRANQRLRSLHLEQSGNRLQMEQQGRLLKAQVDDLRIKTDVLDKAPFGVVIADPNRPDTPMTYVNETFVGMTGYARSELIGRNCRILQGPDTDPAAVAQIRESLQAHRGIHIELINYRRDGQPFWVRLLLFPVFNSEQALISYVACAYDISDLKHATREKDMLAAELQESLKLESLGLTIAGIAHDLNTPMGIALTASTHIRKTVAQMADPTRQGPVPADTVQTWHKSLQQASLLIGNNLAKAADLVRSFKQTTADVSRAEWRRVLLRPYFETLLVSLSPLMRRSQCEVLLDCDDKLALYVEPGLLSQVLANLLVNASIHAFDDQPERLIRLRVHRAEAEMVIEVSDNGVGMTQEAAAKAFSPFFTTRRGSGGSGLGLFTARRIVETTLGGKLSFSTQAGKGTRFVIMLPAERASGSEAHNAPGA